MWLLLSEMNHGLGAWTGQQGAAGPATQPATLLLRDPTRKAACRKQLLGKSPSSSPLKAITISSLPWVVLFLSWACLSNRTSFVYRGTRWPHAPCAGTARSCPGLQRLHPAGLPRGGCSPAEEKPRSRLKRQIAPQVKGTNAAAVTGWTAAPASGVCGASPALLFLRVTGLFVVFHNSRSLPELGIFNSIEPSLIFHKKLLKNNFVWCWHSRRWVTGVGQWVPSQVVVAHHPP